MRFYLTTFLLLAVGVVYINYQISLNSQEESTRFIISQETRESLTANLLDEKLVSKEEALEAKEQLDSVLNNLEEEAVEVFVEPIKTTPQNQKTVEDVNALFVTEEEESGNVNEEKNNAPLTLTKSIPGESITTWDTGKPLTFTFNAEVDAQSFFDSFTISPSVDGKFSGDIMNGADKKTIVLQAIPSLEPGEYTLTLKQGMKSFDKKSELQEDIQVVFTIQ